MMRPLLFLAAGLLLASLAAAQHHASGHVFIADRSNPVSIGVVAPGGSLHTVVVTTALSAQMTLYRGCMDYDNRGYLAAYRDVMTGNGLLRASSGNPTTLLPIGGMPLFGPIPGDVMVDQDGNYTVVTDTPQGSILRVDRLTGSVSTLFASAAILQARAATRDVETGDHLVQTLGGVVCRVDIPAASVITLARLTTTLPFVAPDIACDPRTGFVYSVRFGKGIYRVTPSGQTTLFLHGMPYAATASLVMDRTSARHPRLVCFARGSPPAGNVIYTIDVSGSFITVVSTHAGLLSVSDIFVNRGRNISTILRGNRDWEVALDFPGHAGRDYVLALGVSGTRPGFRVGGRRVALNPDVLTSLSVQDRLAPVVTGTRGRLDANGHGTAFIRARRLPPLNGTRVHLLATVIDPAAPHALAIISDPHLLRIP